MNGRERAVENIQFIAHWNGEVYDVIFAIIRNVYPAGKKNVSINISAGGVRRTLPYDLRLVWARDGRNLS